MRKNATISRLPDTEREEGTHDVDRQKDEALLALIKKGGKSARPLEDDEEEDVSSERRLSLRIPGEIAARIKQAAKARQVKTSSHSWIVEAVIEKLKKESF